MVIDHAIHSTAEVTQCVVGVGSACPFCMADRAEDGGYFEQFHGFRPMIHLPDLPESLRVLQDCFPLGHSGAHLLVIPSTHYRSLAQFEDVAALSAANAGVIRAFSTMFPGRWVLAFEHGAGSIENQSVKCGGCHVDHAHGHLLVLGSECDFGSLLELTQEALVAIGWDLEKQCGSRGEIFGGLSEFVGDHPYLHVAAATPAGHVAHTFKQVDGAKRIPSQLLRRLISTAARRPQAAHWNWKVAIEHQIESRLLAYKQDALRFRRAYRETFGS